MTKTNSTYIKRALTFFFLLTFLFFLFTANTYAENQSGDGLGVRHRIETTKGSFYITIENAHIIEGDIYADYMASEKGENIIIVGVRAILENDDFFYNDDCLYIDTNGAADRFEVTDQDGFSLEAVFGGGLIKDGNYEAGAQVNRGAKKRVLFLYYANKGIEEVIVRFEDGTARVSLADMVNETKNEIPQAAQVAIDEAIAAKEELEKKVSELENKIASLEKQLEDATASSQQQNVQEGTTSPTEQPIEEPTTKPTAKPTEKPKQKQDDVRLERMAKAIFDRILKNPQSLQINNISTEDMEEYYYVYVDYSAQNGFGGYTRDTITIKLNYGIRDSVFAEVIDVGYFEMFYNYREWTIGLTMPY